MDLVSREIAPASVGAEEISGESPVGELFPSPLAEIATLTASGVLEDAISWKRPRLKRLPKLRRRKPQRRRRTLAPSEVIVGTLAGINDDGQPLVRHPLDPSGRLVLARSTVPILPEQIDREVVLAFERGNLGRPIVLGVLRRTPESSQETLGEPLAPLAVPIAAAVDGQRLVFSAEREIVLQCGEASITLTRAGKVLIRGTYLLSRSSGVNRIKGGSVQLN